MNNKNIELNKVSRAIKEQVPEFIDREHGQFVKFLEYYYRSQEKTGLSYNILNNLSNYLDIDEYDLRTLSGGAYLLEDVSATDKTIVVEDVNGFVEENGSILINDEIIFYEKATKSPNIAITDGISYTTFKGKWVELVNLFQTYDSSTVRFSLRTGQQPISPPTANHLIVSTFGKVLIPNVDYTIDGTDIVFTQAPRSATPSDSIGNTYIFYLKGFSQNSIITLDSIQSQFDGNKKEFDLTTTTGAITNPYRPVLCEYTIVIREDQLLIPNVDYSIFDTRIIFKNGPNFGDTCYIAALEAPVPSFGTGASAIAEVESGAISRILVKNPGTGYRIENPPKINISGGGGESATAIADVSGVSTMRLLSGGKGYSETNPPTVIIEEPGGTGISAEITATVEDGAVSRLDLKRSGSNYTTTPRVTFRDPGGATISGCTVSSGSINTNSVTLLTPGQGYSTAPTVYVDPPTGPDGIQAQITATINDNGEVNTITVNNPGRGYLVTPRIAIIDPTQAQVLEVRVDNLGRVVGIDILSGGIGFDDVPSIYIVDNRKDSAGNTIGGKGATATASIFNGSITDINITNFGSGYDQANPPKVYIQRPPEAQASVEIAFSGITGFEILEAGRGYTKSQFEGCARGCAGPIGFDSLGNLKFTKGTVAKAHTVDGGGKVDCLDGLFLKKMLTKFVDQFMPDLPYLDYETVDVNNVIKNIRDFYITKGTSKAVSYLFKILYGEQVDVEYPRQQIIKPSDATWAVDTIVRAIVLSGDPEDLRDGLLVQEADPVDTTVKNAQALVENYLTIQTSEYTIYELILAEETIQGKFSIPYKTLLVEGINATDGIITVDSTVGWPERNGEIIVGNELIRYKEKSLNQFIECTRSINGVIEDWDAGTQVKSNFQIYANKGASNEVQLEILGIAEAGSTVLTDTGSYYLTGDKLTVAKLGATGERPQLDSWVYNVKKLVGITSIVGDSRVATAYSDVDHGLLVGDNVTIYGANPVVYNGQFTVIAINKDNKKEFQYETLTDTGNIPPQGTILASIDLNKGKSSDTNIFNQIKSYTTNIQNTFFNDDYVYIASTGLPNYEIGPFGASALIPGNQRKLNRFPLTVQTISTKTTANPGPIGTFVNGVSVWSYKSTEKKTYGPITGISVTKSGSDYDADSPPIMTIETVAGQTGSGAKAKVVVDGALTGIEVITQGSGYTKVPLVSIVGGGGVGAAATAIVTQGRVSQVLVTNPGTGYTSRPVITISGGGGSGATAEAKVRGPIKSVNLESGGADYTSKPIIKLSSGEGAVAQAIVNNGRIISIAVINAGQGYTTAPNVIIGGDGFGAVARAVIDTDGENAGRVTSIEIQNKGISYVQGTTTIDLVSVGEGAEFDSEVFQWTYNLRETVEADTANGGVFSGYNNQYGGEYGHLSNPQRLRYVLGDNIIQNSNGQLTESENVEHSPIIGWAFDGNPIYGPYGYDDPTDQGSEIQRVITSYRLKQELVYNALTNPNPVRTSGPPLSVNAGGQFVEDYEYVFGLGDLDQYNGRFCKTPEYPDGTYAYFVTIDASENGIPQFPYIMGPSWNSIVDTWNLSRNAVQQNIPEGIIRFRDPYEDVDIDVVRQPNVATDNLTTENGDILLFEPEDVDGDGTIDADETANPQQILEESKLELFDYFPRVSFDSRVDIEVETTTKFEDAKVTGFIVENPGKNYQVNDRLEFDNTNTGGSGASAQVSTIRGKSISSYNFETINDRPYGVITTSDPHEIEIGDKVQVNYNAQLDDSNKVLKVKVIDGIESLNVTQIGTGYNDDVPIQVQIDGDGVDAKIEPVINTTTGSVSSFNIINSGSDFTTDPRIIVSHPQILKKTDYYITSHINNEHTKINDTVVLESKVAYICGETKNSSGELVGFVAKLSSTGAKQWERTYQSDVPATGGTKSCSFKKLVYYNNRVFVVGETTPNQTVQNAYNPDIVFCRFDEAADGLSATLGFQRGIAGISGATRGDHVVDLVQYSDNRFVIGGYTNTNSPYPHDAFVAVVSDVGEFVIKRKIASTNKSEKVIDMVVKPPYIYALMEVAPNASNDETTFAISKMEVESFGITSLWTKEYTQVGNWFKDISFDLNEFDEFVISAGLYDKTASQLNAIWLAKYDIDGDEIWNYRHSIIDITTTTIASVKGIGIDIFGEYNVAVNLDKPEGKRIDIYKFGYDGKISRHSKNEIGRKADGIDAHAGAVDVSGDVYVAGQTYWDRNEFVLRFLDGAANPILDESDNFTPDGTPTPTLTQTNNSGAVDTNRLKFYGKESAGTGSYAATYLKFDDETYGLQDAFGDGEDFTLEMFAFLPSARSSNNSQTHHPLVVISDDAQQNGGIMLLIDQSTKRMEFYAANTTQALDTVSPLTGAAGAFIEDRWHHIALVREGDQYTIYFNGVQYLTGSTTDVSVADRDLTFGQIPGLVTAGVYEAATQFSGSMNFIKLRNRAITSFSVPSDIASSTTENYSFADATFFGSKFTRNSYLYTNDDIPYIGYIFKADKNNDALRLGTFPNNGSFFSTLTLTRTSTTTFNNPTTLNSVSLGTWTLGSTGLQLLDLDNAGIVTSTFATGTSTINNDIWSARTATVPAPGSRKVKVDANVIGKFFIKPTTTVKIDNVLELTLNQSFDFTAKTKLELRNRSTLVNNNLTIGSFINSAYIVDVDKANRKVTIAISNNDWSNDLAGNYELRTVQFSEEGLDITGPVPNDVNRIIQYDFPQVTASTPGVFQFDMSTVSYEGGTLDQFARFFKVDNDETAVGLYSLRVDEVTAGAAYIKGSVIDIPNVATNIAYNNNELTDITISNITGVTKATLFLTLEKVIKPTAVTRTDDVYVVTSSRHYLNAGDMIFVDGNPARTVNNVQVDEYDGAFPVASVIGSKEFTYKLDNVATSDPATSNYGSVEIFAKSPVIKMYYGHQYDFDVSDTSMAGYFLSFSKDNLNKLEYSFNSILRTGVPGQTGASVVFRVTQPEITNISYYFDPSRIGANSPVNASAYLDVVDSPYLGEFTVGILAGATITRGPDVMKFPLENEPEGVANVTRSSYTTSSEKVVGQIGDIRIVNSGGFYQKLPIVSNIVSARKIERVNIIEPGTEYKVGVYYGVPILGDGEGGVVQITVSDGEDAEGVTIPGQISSIVISNAGKGYSTARIDIEAIPEILGPGLTGSGAELEVEIPPFGSGASIFTKGNNVGKIKKLKNNNFGYDYPHDYTLRPEITFPINAQLINTSILRDITVTDPGSGYSQPPAVIIEGGGGSGAIAESFIKNGRIDKIVVKDPGAGYSSEPSVSLKSSFNYVVNLDLGLLQFSYPHGIVNGAEVQLQTAADGSTPGAFPIAAGAVGTLNSTTTYYAISGTANSLEDDQLKLAITANNAELGDSITFVNAGTGRQTLLTDSFGGAATANVGTGEFLAGEEIYQGENVNNPTALGFVSENDGWLVGPRLLKLVDYTGNFELGEKVTGKISKSSGIIADLAIARGVLDIDSITRTTGQFIDDVGKLSEIIQKVQDSYFYQSFSYVVQSSVSIENWRELVTTNCHPAGFKLFGELNLSDKALIENRKTDFELTKSVNLSDAAVVPNIQNFALVEPIYTQYNNSEVLFRQRRLTSSENILTSIVQRLDDVSEQFDGERISFPLTVNQEPVSAAANQLMIVLNGVVQNPGVAFDIQGSSIVFSEPPQPNAMVQYANVELAFITVFRFSFSNVSGIFPTLGQTIFGLTSNWRGTVIRTSGNDIDVIFNGQTGTQLTTVGGLQESTAPENGYVIGETMSVSATGFLGTLGTVTTIKDSNNSNDYLFEFGEDIVNFAGEKAKVEEINLSVGQQSPIAKLRYTIGTGTTNVEIISYGSTTQVSEPPPAGTFEVGKQYQFGSEIFTVTEVQNPTAESLTLVVLRGQSGTAPAQQQEGGPVYSTEVEVTQEMAISKTTGTYQSTPGLLEVQQYDILVGLKSDVVAFVTRAFNYTDDVSGEAIPRVVISEGSTFFGLLFNRISNATYPNVVLDNIADSQIQVNDFETNLTSFDSNFPSGESVNNYTVVYANESGAIQEGENIRNYKFSYGNEVGTLAANETAQVRQIAIKNFQGDGFFSAGQILRSEQAKAEILGYSAGQNIIYVGKTGRGTSTGADFHDATFNGDAVLSTTQAKFGSSSLYIDGTVGDNLTIPSSSEFAFGTDAFTIECWIYPEADALTGEATFLDMRASEPDVAVRMYLNNGIVTVTVNGSVVANSGTAVLSAGSWYHVAYSRSSGNGALFLDGVNRGNGTDANSYPAKGVAVGGALTSNYFTGFIDEVMIRTDQAYSANFTPMTGIYQGVAGIKLLLHMEQEYNTTTTHDWSGAAAWTAGDEFVNNGILFRYYDAADQVEANIDLIAAEAVYRMDRNFPRLHIPAAVDSDRGADSHNLLLANLDFIANEAYERIGPTPPGGTTATDCIDDVKDVVRNIAYNLKYGFNSKTWDAADLYTNGTVIQHLSGNETDSVNVFNEARDIAKQVINNTAVTISGSHGLTQTTDSTITGVFGGCTNIETAIDNLMKIVTDTVMDPDGNDAATYPSSISQITRTHPVHAQCTLDTKKILQALIKDVRNGGNANIWDAAAQYVNRSVTPITLNHIVGEEAETIWAINKANEIAKEVMRSTTVTIEGDHGYTQSIDATITVDPAGTPYCADVATAMDNLITIITTTLDEAYVSAAELAIDANAQAVDHLATVTRTIPVFPWAGGEIYAYRADDLVVRYVNTTDDEFYVNEIYPDSQYRFIDAADLIQINSEAIIDETAGLMLDRYPSLAQEMPRNGDGSGAGTQRCKTDLAQILAAMVKDLKFGGNRYTVEAAKFYLGLNDEIQHVRLQLYASLFAHEQLGEMAKLAITGDLEAAAQYTDAVIISDIGITNDPGNCANVKTAIDNLITAMNDILSPVGDRYKDAVDLIKFNKQYITEEAIGLMEDEFFYQLSSGATYQSFQYPGGSVDGRNKCIRDAGLILEGVMADLLTGGNNSSLRAVETYLNSRLEILHVEDQLTSTLYAFEQLQFLAKKAVNNLLQTANNIQLSNDHYVAQHTTRQAFADTSITHDQSTPGGLYTAADCANVQSSIDNLFTAMLSTLAPGDDPARSAAQIMLFNKNYYQAEIEQDVSNQWGASAWNTEFEDFIDQVADDVIHDIVLTDISSVPANTEINNTQTLNSLRSLQISSNLVAGLNLIPALQTEEISLGTGWNANANLSVTLNGAVAPDGTTTADLVIPANNSNDKAVERSYVLTAYTTFDRDNVTFDSDSESFDAGVNVSVQRYTYSIFFKEGGNDRARLKVGWNAQNYVFFTIDLTNGNSFSVNQSGIQPVATGVFPQGDGWYRAFITIDVPFGVSSLDLCAYGTSNGSTNTAGDGVAGVYMWGAKLNKGDLDVYQSQNSTQFFPDNSLNIRTYILAELKQYMNAALAQTLTTPSPIATFLSYTDTDRTNQNLPSLGTEYTTANAQAVVNYLIGLYESQLIDSSYYTTLSGQNNITLVTKTYGTRNIPVPFGGEIQASSFVYGLLSDANVEVRGYSANEGEVVKEYLRLTVSGITDGPFVLNDTVQKQGDSAVTGTIYSFWSDENFSYLDIDVTGGIWAIADIVQSDEGAYATVDAIEKRLHIIGLQGDFVTGVPFKGYTSGQTATTSSFIKSEAAVLSNVGGKLTVDTESLVGPFETTSVVYPENSRQYIDINQFAGLELNVGERIVSDGYVRYGVQVQGNLNVFEAGGILYGVTGGTKDTSRRAIITEVDLDNNFIYAQPYLGSFGNGDGIAYYGAIDGEFPVGYAVIQTTVTTAGNAAAKVVDIKTVGTSKRVFLEDIRGTWSARETLKARAGYRAQVAIVVDLKARVKRSFRGFDGVQTTFKLTTANGTPYFPDPEGHMMIFINGILQPPGSGFAYTAFSDNIQFEEAPEVGASFVGIYFGKLRQLDDISFEFDSLRQSFNLRRGGTFYSLTLTDGVQSAVVRPENNIIVSLNGVIQEPGVAFNLVGSRIIFAEVPRVGSTFVAFSYVGSEADVDAETVIPPIEPGDFIDIGGETSDREVAVIESSNSLITFDYLGSVFGKDAAATANITKGTIREARVTSGGSGYTSRPLVRVDSISGYDANIKALVGVERVELTNRGTGYKYPVILAESSVPDDWTAPNLDLYPEDGTPAPVIDTIGAGGVGSGAVTETEEALGVRDDTESTTGGTTAGGGIPGATAGGTVVEELETVPPSSPYDLTGYTATSIWSSSST